MRCPRAGLKSAHDVGDLCAHRRPGGTDPGDLLLREFVGRGFDGVEESFLARSGFSGRETLPDRLEHLLSRLVAGALQHSRHDVTAVAARG